MTTFHPRIHAEFEHPALVYSSTDELARYMTDYVHRGVDEDAFVFVAAGKTTRDVLHESLGPLTRSVTLVDSAEWHAHPASRLDALYHLATVANERGPRPLRLAIEPVWPRRRELVLEWQRYESALNHVLAPFEGSLVCLYDATSVEEAILEVAEATHPFLHRGSDRRASTCFEQPDAFLRRWHDDAAVPASDPRRVDTVDELSSVRTCLRQEATDVGIPLERAQDLCLAANEILTNALVYGDGPVEMWTYIEDEEYLVTQVRDHGNGISDPLAGYRPPSAFKPGGRGMWLARQVLDLLQIVPTESGTVAKLYMHV